MLLQNFTTNKHGYRGRKPRKVQGRLPRRVSAANDEDSTCTAAGFTCNGSIKQPTPQILLLVNKAEPSIFDARANWQINIYSDAKHSFTGEGIVRDRTPEAGLHPQTDARSWQTTVEFLREVLH